MSEYHQPTSEEVERWKRRGGVDLARVEDPSEKNSLAAQLRVGVLEEKTVIYVYRCEICGRIERTPQAMEPMCTGPSWTDDHVPEVMVAVV